MLQVTKVNSELNIKITGKINLKAQGWISTEERYPQLSPNLPFS